MWSAWLWVMFAAWAAPTPGPALPSAPPAREPARGMVKVEHAVTVLWWEGDVRTAPWAAVVEADRSTGAARAPRGGGPGRAAPPLPVEGAEVSAAPLGGAVLVGDPLGADVALLLSEGARAVLLVDGDRLVAVRGPGRLRRERASLEVLAGASARELGLAGYREGPLPMIPAPVSLPADESAAAEVGLALLAPAATTLRDPRPIIRWRWPEPEGRFDVTVTRLGGRLPPGGPSRAGAGAPGQPEEVLVERWQGVTGRSLTLWAPLARGARYAATVTLSGGPALGRAFAARAAFDVLGDSEEEAVSGSLGALTALVQPGESLRPELEVLRARLLESYGLLADAERIWSALALLYPGHAELRYQARRLHEASRVP